MEDRVGHGAARMAEIDSTFTQVDEDREQLPTEAELRALGSIITLEGADPAFPLKLNPLEQWTAHKKKRPKWLLLTVMLGDKENKVPDRATVWVSDEYRGEFVELFNQYLSEDTPKGRPRNQELVANIGRIRTTVLTDLWQSDDTPPRGEVRWWEVWLAKSEDGPYRLQQFADASKLRISSRIMRLIDRDVMWIESTWASLEILPFTAVPVAELREPEFIDSIGDLGIEEQAEYVADLAERLEPADEAQPAVCHLDTGVARNHLLLRDSLSEGDLHTVLGESGFDHDGHGTRMAGVALYGDGLDEALIGGHVVQLRHRLESVRILPRENEKDHDPLAYGDVTAQAVSLPEIAAPRQRVFCMPVSTVPDTHETLGQPTLWSATVDALAAGAGVVRAGHELHMLSAPDADAARLFFIAAGNTRSFNRDHLNHSDLSPVHDPAQSWNALTVGAYTDLIEPPTDPGHENWAPLATKGELSPHSSTSLLFGDRPWPAKPDILMEGGNVLHDGGSLFEDDLSTLTVRTAGHHNDQVLANANATSAATAQAARLGALVMANYPAYWPETVRALLVHGAEWTPVMREQINSEYKKNKNLTARHRMLRRYGWGVPTEENVLHSSNQAVTIVVQDEFTPFRGTEFKIPHFRFHDLPWPREVLRDLVEADVTLRVTLSYFIEPTASRRGWRQRYQYKSHGLRFELQGPLESETDFIQRVNRQAQSEEAGQRPSSGGVDWFIGPNQRHQGSLHQDIWETSAANLADTGKIAIYPVGGWWKNNSRRDRVDRPVRYSLVVSLKTEEEGIDLYTPIATQVDTPVQVPVEIEL